MRSSEADLVHGQARDRVVSQYRRSMRLLGWGPRSVLRSHKLARTQPRFALFEFLDPMSCGLSAFGRFFSSVRAHD